MKKSLIVFFIVVLSNLSCAMQLSEIMYDPSDGNEWVEFWTDAQINISDFTIADNYQEDNIVCCDAASCSTTIPEDTFFIITDSAAPGPNVFCVDDSKIGNGLGNSGDSIILSENRTVLINFSYSQTVEKGHSLSLIDGIYIETEPTPLQANMVPDKEPEEEPVENPDEEPEEESDEAPEQEQEGADIELDFNVEAQLFTGTAYSSFFRLENLDYPSYNEEISVTLFYNYSIDEKYYEGISINTFKSSKTAKTSNMTFPDPGEYIVCARADIMEDPEPENNMKCQIFQVTEITEVQCDISLQTYTDKQVYEAGEKVSLFFSMGDTSFPFEVSYWVEDIFGDTVKEKTVSKNTNTKHFTLNADEKDRAFIVYSELQVMCDNTDKNNTISQLIIVKGDEAAASDESAISVEKISDSAVFGDSISVTMALYKGSTRKSAMKAYVTDGDKKVSQETSLSFDKSHTEYKMTFPIHLKDDCRLDEGKYTVRIEGLDLEYEKDIEISNAECPEAPVAMASRNPKMYEILSVVQSDEQIIAIIRLNNDDEAQHTYSVSGKINDGRKTVSEIEAELAVDEGAEKITTLVLIKPAAGEYDLRIKILRDDRKTPYELNEKISVEESTKSEIETGTHEKSPEPEVITELNTLIEETPKIEVPKQTPTASIIYQSKNEIIKDKTIYLILLVFILVSIAVFIKIKNQ